MPFYPKISKFRFFYDLSIIYSLFHVHYFFGTKSYTNGNKTIILPNLYFMSLLWYTSKQSHSNIASALGDSQRIRVPNIM